MLCANGHKKGNKKGKGVSFIGSETPLSPLGQSYFLLSLDAIWLGLPRQAALGDMGKLKPHEELDGMATWVAWDLGHETWVMCHITQCLLKARWPTNDEY